MTDLRPDGDAFEGPPPSYSPLLRPLFEPRCAKCGSEVKPASDTLRMIDPGPLPGGIESHALCRQWHVEVRFLDYAGRYAALDAHCVLCGKDEMKLVERLADRVTLRCPCGNEDERPWPGVESEPW